MRRLSTISIMLLSSTGCSFSDLMSGAAEGIVDPTERGLMYIAAAITLAGILNLFT